jgi:hypothetical protein
MKVKLGIIFFLGCLFFSVAGYSQLYKISGQVTDSKKEPLALASLEIKELRKGIVTRDDGSYEFFLERGKYDLVISIIGYKTRVLTFYINNEDIVEDIILEPEAEDLSEVVIKAKLRDRAEEYIRNVIKNKGIILDAIGSYSCNIYVRAFQLDSGFSKKRRGEDSIGKDDYNNMSMTEVSQRLDKSSSGQTKEERLGVNKRGKTESLFYLSATDGDFYLYDNLIHAPPVSKIPFVSPLSYSGLLAYRFKTLKIDRSKKPREYTVAIRPRQLSNATIEGEIVIQDSTWAILSATFRLPPAHMPEYDFLEVKQVYSKVGDSARMISRQQFNYYIKTKKGRLHGETIAVYSGYELNKNFRRGYFGTEVSTTTKEAYEKDSSFWNSVRTEPLSRQQELYTRYQDSIYKLMRSEAYLDSVDRVLNKVTWKKMLIFGQIFNDHKKERMWILPPLTTVFQPIQFGGSRIRLEAAYKKTFPSRKDIYLQAQASYGFRNGDINGRIDLKRKYNPFNRGQFNLSAGRDFAFIFDGDAWVNMLKRSNIYLNNYFGAGHELELLNGLWLSNQFEIAFRRSVSKYITNPKADSLFGGLLANDQPVEFEPYNAFYSEAKLYFTPRLPYIREPKEKIYLPGKWPTFYVKWRKGIPGIFRSEIDFDYLEYGIEQKINFGVMGVTSYTIKTGNTPNKKNLRIVDYQFQRRGDPLLFLNPNRAFQSLDSTFALFERFYQGNLVHEFNGALVNRIPFFKKLKIQEMAGAGFLVAQERNLVYTELFAGLERVFKWPPNPLSRFKLGVYVVSSFANTFRNPIQFKIGITTWDRFKNRWR